MSFLEDAKFDLGKAQFSLMPRLCRRQRCGTS